MPRREARLRLVPVASPARRVSEKERQEVRALLVRARRDGRFGSFDLYEQRLEALVSDLGYRIERVDRAPGLRTLASRVAPQVAAGAGAGEANRHRRLKVLTSGLSPRPAPWAVACQCGASSRCGAPVPEGG